MQAGLTTAEFAEIRDRIETSLTKLLEDSEDEERFDSLLEDLVQPFEDWLDRSDAPDPTREIADVVVAAMVAWKWGYTDGRLNRWTVEDLEEFFLDHAPRKLPSDDEFVEHAPTSGALFMRFLNEVGVLSGDPVTELVVRCALIQPHFAYAARDPRKWGPSKTLVTQMRAEGVDPTDKDALAAWMDEFNSRTWEERDRVLGPALDQRKPEPPDLEDVGGTLTSGEGEAMALAMTWFPAGEYEAALQRWDELAEQWGEIPHDEYCRRMEATFRGWASRGTRPRLVAVRIEPYAQWCRARDEDPAEARARYAASKLGEGEAGEWPPGRNDPCWCGSERKYKRCCGTVTASALHPLDSSL